MAERIERCETCQFFDVAGIDNSGGCHVGPRQFVGFGASGTPIFMWPRQYQDDWCGEWKPIPAVEPPQ